MATTVIFILGLEIRFIHIYIQFYRKSASCTYVSALLHALSALHAPSAFEPSIQRVDSDDDDDEESLPCTSQPCRWKPPKKCKESVLRLSDATFVKHDYAKPEKKKIKQVEDFDPRPDSFRGTASQGLPELLQKVKGEQLCASLLFDPQFQAEEVSSPSSHNIPDMSNLKDTILNFKETLSITPERSHEIERSTREQRNSDLWFSMRRYRITLSGHRPVTYYFLCLMSLIQLISCLLFTNNNLLMTTNVML